MQIYTSPQTDNRATMHLCVYYIHTHACHAYFLAIFQVHVYQIYLGSKFGGFPGIWDLPVEFAPRPHISMTHNPGMCGVKLEDRVSSKGLRERLGLDDIISVLLQNRLRWYGYVMR